MSTAPVFPAKAHQGEIWARLLHSLRQRLPAFAGRTAVLGIVGLPGCGKSTLAARLLSALALPHSLTVSLDDFYLDREERRLRGLPFRGPPGTHDLPRLDRFLSALTAGAPELEVPVFDREHEQRLPGRLVHGPLTLCVLEGWFVGARCAGYERLADSLDLLLYLDMELADARAARFARESELRRSGHGGMDQASVARFWNEAILPYVETLVLPLRARAELCLSQSATHELRDLRLTAPSAR